MRQIETVEALVLLSLQDHLDDARHGAVQSLRPGGDDDAEFIDVAHLHLARLASEGGVDGALQGAGARHGRGEDLGGGEVGVVRGMDGRLAGLHDHVPAVLGVAGEGEAGALEQELEQGEKLLVLHRHGGAEDDLTPRDGHVGHDEIDLEAPGDEIDQHLEVHRLGELLEGDLVLGQLTIGGLRGSGRGLGFDGGLASLVARLGMQAWRDGEGREGGA
ncbi:MAG: hypothetical protein EA376_03500 [Phycisphaeraceae bacterium]|nr:MAG: hypothetical protein EA376_03500 [Phycisphaeraceae bacterium]